MSQNNFVDQVAKTLRESDKAETEESFIFGISGKWGEGKTHFLNALEEVLQNEFIIVKINPWKYAYDKPAFLRHFLEQTCLGVGIENQSDELRYETTQNKLSKYWYVPLAAIVLVCIIILGVSYPSSFGIPICLSWTSSILYSFFKESRFWQDLLKIKSLLFLLVTAAILPPLISLMTFQKKNPITSTLDEFNDRLDKILRHAEKPIVYYVDDLDRVTPKIAREVLDTMRTFFDKKELIFVVTGDHSVLERYIGNEILPGKSENEQIEEGRRYLKKILV